MIKPIQEGCFFRLKNLSKQRPWDPSIPTDEKWGCKAHWICFTSDFGDGNGKWSGPGKTHEIVLTTFAGTNVHKTSWDRWFFVVFGDCQQKSVPKTNSCSLIGHGFSLIGHGFLHRSWFFLHRSWFQFLQIRFIGILESPGLESPESSLAPSATYQKKLRDWEGFENSGGGFSKIY